MPKKDDRPAWQTPVIYTGMIMTIVSVILAQFVKSAAVEMGLVGIALVGIVLSMAPFWPRSFKELWQSLRRLARDANRDDPY